MSDACPRAPRSRREKLRRAALPLQKVSWLPDRPPALLPRLASSGSTGRRPRLQWRGFTPTSLALLEQGAGNTSEGFCASASPQRPQDTTTRCRRLASAGSASPTPQKNRACPDNRRFHLGCDNPAARNASLENDGCVPIRRLRSARPDSYTLPPEGAARSNVATFTRRWRSSHGLWRKLQNG